MYDLQLTCGLNIILQSNVENKCSADVLYEGVYLSADKNSLSLFLIKILFVIIIDIKNNWAFAVSLAVHLSVPEEGERRKIRCQSKLAIYCT